MNSYGYARVSTIGQDLAGQIEQLVNSGVSKEYIYSEKFTGTTTDRPKFKELCELLKSGDTIVITKLDRLARNTKEALSIIEELMESNININVLNIGIIENTTIGKLIYTVLLAVAEMERDMIVERTQEGKRYAKKSRPDFREGRPKRKLNDRYMKALEVMKSHSIAETALITDISTATLKRIRKQYKNEVENGMRKDTLHLIVKTKKE